MQLKNEQFRISTMSNINPTPRKKAQETASAFAASSAQGYEAAIRSFLTRQFNGDTSLANKVYDKAMASIPAKDKIGKNLSFDIVKKAILEAAEKENKSINPRSFDELKSLFPQEKAGITKDDDPFQNIKDALQSLDMARRAAADLKNKFDDARAEEERNDLRKKNEEIQRMQKKKQFDTNKKV